MEVAKVTFNMKQGAKIFLSEVLMKIMAITTSSKIFSVNILVFLFEKKMNKLH